VCVGFQSDISQIQYIAVVRGHKVVVCTCARMEHISGACLFGKSPASGNMIGVNMGIDHVLNLHPVLLRRSKIELDIINRVAHGGQALAASTKQIGNGNNGRCMKKLAQNHFTPPHNSVVNPTRPRWRTAEFSIPGIPL
jgi:hypothetical protein